MQVACSLTDQGTVGQSRAQVCMFVLLHLQAQSPHLDSVGGVLALERVFQPQHAPRLLGMASPN